VLLFRCLTGSYPFHGANSTATMIAHLNQPTPTFFSVAPDLEVPDGLENVTRRCLAKNPAERFQTMEELQDALSYFLNITPDQYRTVTRTHATLERFVPELRRRRSPAVWIAVGVVGAMVLTGVTFAGLWAGVQMFGAQRLAPGVEAGGPSHSTALAVQPVEAPATEALGAADPATEAVEPDAPAAAPEVVEASRATADGSASKKAVSPRRPQVAAKPKAASAKGGTSSGSSAGTAKATPDAGKPAAADTDSQKVELGKGFANDMDDW
jgi:serine/threonine-protein kinase